VFGKITGNSELVAGKRWAYTLQPVTVNWAANTVANVDGSSTLTAYNIQELTHAANTEVSGGGIQIEDCIDISDDSSGTYTDVTLRPVGYDFGQSYVADVVVQYWLDGGVAFFDRANPISVNCDTSGGCP